MNKESYLFSNSVRANHLFYTKEAVNAIVNIFVFVLVHSLAVG